MKYAAYDNELLKRAIENLKIEVQYQESKRDYKGMMEAKRELKEAKAEQAKR